MIGAILTVILAAHASPTVRARTAVSLARVATREPGLVETALRQIRAASPGPGALVVDVRDGRCTVFRAVGDLPERVVFTPAEVRSAAGRGITTASPEDEAPPDAVA